MKIFDTKLLAARRGVTLIEAVLFISVALGLIVGGMVFYQQASRAALWKDISQTLTAIDNEIGRIYYGAKGDMGIPTNQNYNFTPVLISSGSIPPHMLYDNNVNSVRLGGNRADIRFLNISGRDVAGYELYNVPAWLCNRLIRTDNRAVGILKRQVYQVRLRTGGKVTGGTGTTYNHYPLFSWSNPPARTSTGPITPSVASSLCDTVSEAEASSNGLIGLTMFVMHRY